MRNNNLELVLHQVATVNQWLGTLKQYKHRVVICGEPLSLATRESIMIGWSRLAQAITRNHSPASPSTKVSFAAVACLLISLPMLVRAALSNATHYLHDSGAVIEGTCNSFFFLCRATVIQASNSMDRRGFRTWGATSRT